jgi:hypothetical protein
LHHEKSLQEKKQQTLKDVATMEEEMIIAKAELERRNREADEHHKRQAKVSKIITPGRPEPQTPRTPSVRSRFGL